MKKSMVAYLYYAVTIHGGLPSWIVTVFFYYRRTTEMVLGKAVVTPSHLKKNLSGKTISTSLCQQAKRASIVSFPLSQQTNVVVSPWIIAIRVREIRSRFIANGIRAHGLSNTRLQHGNSRALLGEMWRKNRTVIKKH